MLVLTRSVGTAVFIGDHIVLKVIEISGDKVCVGIEAPQEIKVEPIQSSKRQKL